MLGLREILAEAALPFRSLQVLPTIVAFTLFIALANAAGLLGLWLMVVIVPAFARYLLFYLEARSRDTLPEVIGIELFSWVGNFWSLFPIVPVGGFAFAIGYAQMNENVVLAWTFGILAALLLPASFAVLAITHSPLQSLNPVTLVRLIHRVFKSYWLAPVTIGLAVWISEFLHFLPGLVGDFFGLAILIITFGLLGAMLRPHDVVDDIDIDTADDVVEERLEVVNQKQRENNLGIAYGFASRGNLAGALDHLQKSLKTDRDASSAWGWYFEHMLKWEEVFPAMKFGQLYLRHLLEEDRYREVNKITMRCRMIDDNFKPLPEDVPLVTRILRESGNGDVADALSR